MKKLTILLIIIGLGVAGYFLYRGSKNGSKYEFVKAGKGSVSREISVTGRVESAKEVSLGFERAGKIKAVYAQVGQSVKPNQVLAQLEEEDTATQARQQQFVIDGAVFQLKQTESGIRAEYALFEEMKKTATDTLTPIDKRPSIEQLYIQEEKIRQAQSAANAQLAQVRQAQTALQRILEEEDKSQIVSPIAGTVSKQEVRVGELAAPNQPLIVVASQDAIQIEAQIPEVDVAKLAADMPAKVSFDALGKDFIVGAKIISIDPAAIVVDGVATYRMLLSLDQVDERIKLGMTADIDIVSESRDDVVLIPQRAIFTQNGEKFVRVLKDGDGSGRQLQKVKVTTGLRGENGTIEITEDLSEGDTVVLSTEVE